MFTDELGTSDRLLSIAAGVLLLFLGVAMLSSHLVTPIARVVGLPARTRGRRCRPARERERRAQPLTDGRDGGCADDRDRARLVHRDADERDEGVEPRGDRGAGHRRLRRDVAGRVHAVRRSGRRCTRGVVRARRRHERPLGRRPGRTATSAEIGGIEPDTIADAYVFDWRDGDDGVLATLGTTNAVVSSNFADDHDISVGDTVTIRSTADRAAKVTVVGTFEPPPFYPLLESVNVSTKLFDSLYDRPRNRWTWANVAGDSTDESRAQMEAAISGFPDTQLETREEWIDREDADFNEFISFLYVMLTLAVFVSVFGMINTLVLSVYERTREIGMLRAIGMTRRQVRRMIRQESIITALIGAALGLPLGIFLAALVNRAL